MKSRNIKKTDGGDQQNLSLERAAALLAVHLGIVDEDAIWEMRYPFFNACLIELGLKLNYDAVVCYAGNSFAEKSWDMIAKANPMRIDLEQLSRETHGVNALTAFVNAAGMKIMPPGKEVMDDE